MNNNGHKMVALCRNLDVHIVNGRIGADKEKGLLTCDNASAIDYALASSELFLCLEDFRVDIFDKMLSDKHCPVTLTLNVKSLPQSPPNVSGGNYASTGRSGRQVISKIVWGQFKES